MSYLEIPKIIVLCCFKNNVEYHDIIAFFQKLNSRAQLLSASSRYDFLLMWHIMIKKLRLTTRGVNQLNAFEISYGVCVVAQLMERISCNLGFLKIHLLVGHE